MVENSILGVHNYLIWCDIFIIGRYHKSIITIVILLKAIHGNSKMSNIIQICQQSRKDM